VRRGDTCFLIRTAKYLIILMLAHQSLLTIRHLYCREGTVALMIKRSGLPPSTKCTRGQETISTLEGSVFVLGGGCGVRTVHVPSIVWPIAVERRKIGGERAVRFAKLNTRVEGRQQVANALFGIRRPECDRIQVWQDANLTMPKASRISKVKGFTDLVR